MHTEIVNINDTNHEIRVCDVDMIKLYCASDIGKALKLSNIHKSMYGIPVKEKAFIKCITKGGPQNILFVTMTWVRYLISKCRTVHAIQLAQHFNIDVINIHNVSIESSTINNIMKAFNGEKMFVQYQVCRYRIDLYFADYKLAIECDENHHTSTETYDKEREQKIQSEIGCTFLRYQPQMPDFDIFQVINRIYKHINISKGIYK